MNRIEVLCSESKHVVNGLQSLRKVNLTWWANHAALDNKNLIGITFTLFGMITSLYQYWNWLKPFNQSVVIRSVQSRGEIKKEWRCTWHQLAECKTEQNSEYMNLMKKHEKIFFCGRWSFSIKNSFTAIIWILLLSEVKTQTFWKNILLYGMWKTNCILNCWRVMKHLLQGVTIPFGVWI